MEDFPDKLILVHYIDGVAKVCREEEGLEKGQDYVRRWRRRGCWHEVVCEGLTIDLKYAIKFYRELEEVARDAKAELESKTSLSWSTNVVRLFSTVSISLIAHVNEIYENELPALDSALKEFEHRIRMWYIQNVYPHVIAMKLDD